MMIRWCRFCFCFLNTKNLNKRLGKWFLPPINLLLLRRILHLKWAFWGKIINKKIFSTSLSIYARFSGPEKYLTICRKFGEFLNCLRWPHRAFFFAGLKSQPVWSAHGCCRTLPSSAPLYMYTLSFFCFLFSSFNPSKTAALTPHTVSSEKGILGGVVLGACLSQEELSCLASDDITGEESQVFLATGTRYKKREWRDVLYRGRGGGPG